MHTAMHEFIYELIETTKQSLSSSLMESNLNMESFSEEKLIIVAEKTRGLKLKH